MATLTANQRKQLGRTVRRKRDHLGLSAREVARRAGVDVGTLIRIEDGTTPKPTVESLTAIAEVLDIPTADIFAITQWLQPDALPTFTPYLRAKYHDMPEAAIAEMETYFQTVADRHRIAPSGPQAGEDE